MKHKFVLQKDGITKNNGKNNKVTHFEDMELEVIYFT